MRLWTLHPKYLDQKGLVALWREGLLAKKVLSGRTKGYRSHPQLLRFKNSENPLIAIDAYLTEVWMEGRRRGYLFNRSKVRIIRRRGMIKTKRGQLEFEYEHLLRKLERRSPEDFIKLKKKRRILQNPVFKIVPGGVEEWEKI
ncbi:MAG: pyrimidine dimer DNA glycosylase/endonuclease V [Candidatus Woesearchaeota archaeon]